MLRTDIRTLAGRIDGGKPDADDPTAHSAAANCAQRVPHRSCDGDRWFAGQRTQDRGLPAGSTVEVLHPPRTVLVDLGRGLAEAAGAAGVVVGGLEGRLLARLPRSDSGGRHGHVDV